MSLQYYTTWELRAEIVDACTVQTDVTYGPGRTGIVKEDLVAVAHSLDVDTPEDTLLSDLTLRELYQLISNELGMEPPETAGNQWGLNKEHLKAIHRRVTDE